MNRRLAIRPNSLGGPWTMDADADVDAMDGPPASLKGRRRLWPAHSAHNGLDNVAAHAVTRPRLARGHVAHSAHSPYCWIDRSGTSTGLRHERHHQIELPATSPQELSTTAPTGHFSCRGTGQYNCRCTPVPYRAAGVPGSLCPDTLDSPEYPAS